MKARTFFVGALLAAAVLPVFDRLFSARAAERGQTNAAVAMRDSSFAWPTHFRGRPLTQLPLSPLELRFAQRFPGAIARFTDGSAQLVVRRVTHATRTLHPAADCFKAVGYDVAAARAHAEPDGMRWSCFIAEKDGVRLRVCERIVDEGGGVRFTDVSSWYWHALTRGGAPWWAITVVTPLAPAVRGV
jgi:hypothetical protein